MNKYLLCKRHWLIISLLCSCAFLAAPDEYPSASFSGNVMLDYDRFDTAFLENPTEYSKEYQDSVELRRLRLRFKSDISKNWRSKLSVDLRDGSEIKDAYIQYRAWDFANITVGKQKEPFGLEWLTGSKDLSTIERSISTAALAPSRALGINLSGNQDKLSWHLGYFQNDNTQKSQAITGRVTWAPWYVKKNLIHVGMSFSERDLKGDEYRINERLEVHSADSLFEGTRFDAENASLLGIEFMSQYKGLLALGEWQQAKLEAIDGSVYEYDGGYFQLSYLLSGKNRKYKNGELDSMSHKNDWEFILRHSNLLLVQEDSEANITTAGINYYASKNLKLMAHYIRSDRQEQGIDMGIGNAVSLRVQYKFAYKK